MTTKKHILFVHYSLPPVVGGVESVLKPMAELFAKNGYLVTLLAGTGSVEGTNIKTSLLPDLNPDHPHIREMQRIFNLGVLPDNYELRLQNLERRIEAEIGNIEHIIIHNIMSMPDNLTATEALWNYIQKYPQKKYYLYLHDLAWLMDDIKPHLFDRRPWNLLKTALPNVQYVTVSEVRRRQIAELFNIPRRQITVVPNGIKYQDFFKFDDGTPSIIEHIDIFKKYPVVLIPARLIPRKNIVRSLQIIRNLKHDYPDILSIITGPFYPEYSDNHAYLQILREFIRTNELTDHVFFLSDILNELKIPQNKNLSIVRDLYFLSHLVLYLSLDEGFGLPILEAGLARAPLVMSSIPVFREIAGDCCLVLPDDESIEYNTNRIKCYLDTAQSSSGSLFHRIFQKYNWDNIWKQYLQPLVEK